MIRPETVDLHVSPHADCSVASSGGIQERLRRRGHQWIRETTSTRAYPASEQQDFAAGVFDEQQAPYNEHHPKDFVAQKNCTDVFCLMNSPAVDVSRPSSAA